MAVQVFYDGAEWDARRAAAARPTGTAFGGRYIAAKNMLDAAIVVARLLWVRCGIVEIRVDPSVTLDDRIAREALADRIDRFADIQRAGAGIQSDLRSAASLIRGWVPVRCDGCGRANDMPDYCSTCSGCPTGTL
jgi:hypothetical protein